ncbi:MAG TPA: alpha/beta hydrolase [Rhodocyclaceae bacterium]|nr:alpha/beta hydrolase [Rhodocyclaceae bacterium]
MATEHILLGGTAGNLEVFIDTPEGTPTGIAIIGHPHPLKGGNAEHKVVTTLMRTFRDLGCVVLRPSFRGVGGSEGAHDHGNGETNDLISVYAYAYHTYGNLPLYLAGFSFGAFVATKVAKALEGGDTPAKRLFLVGSVAGYLEGTEVFNCEPVPADTVIIHGELDETVPLKRVLDWATPMDLPVTVVPGAGHFFDRKLHIVRNIINAAWKE